MASKDSLVSVRQTFVARADHYANETSWVQSRRLISPLLPNGRPPRDGDLLLDLCAGTGAVSSYAQMRGWRVHAMDLTAPMLAQIASPAIVKLVGDATNTPFLDGSFDIVTMRQALHYLDLDSALKEMLRISRRSIALGHITLWRDADKSVWADYFSVASPGRKHIFAPGDISQAVRRAGGRVVSELVRESREQFAGPILHIGEPSASGLCERFLAAPSSFRKAHELTGDDLHSLQLSLRWEFVRAVRD